MQKSIVYPYIPNSVPEIKAQMMKDIGVGEYRRILFQYSE